MADIGLGLINTLGHVCRQSFKFKTMNVAADQQTFLPPEPVHHLGEMPRKIMKD